jgi:hypothetical protein
MAKRPLTRVELIILISTVNCVILLLGYLACNKRPNRDIYIPRSYEGWVSIRYGVPGAPAIDQADGVEQVAIPDSGALETSDPLHTGWRRTRYFWTGDGDTTLIPAMVEQDRQPYLYIHDLRQLSRTWEYVAISLQPGQDTTFWDKTRIEKSRYGRITYTPGRKSLEYFYVTAAPRPVSFIPPALVAPEALQSVEDRAIPIK